MSTDDRPAQPLNKLSTNTSGGHHGLDVLIGIVLRWRHQPVVNDAMSTARRSLIYTDPQVRHEYYRTSQPRGAAER